jgi:hypothetical protein
MKIKVLFFFFLFSIFIFLNQVDASTPLVECPKNAIRCYVFERGYRDDKNNFVKTKGPATAFFPGLVPCGVGICIGAEWVRAVRVADDPPTYVRTDTDPPQYVDPQVPGWYCPNPGTFDPEGHHCTICHLFVLFFTVVSFIFLTLVPMLAAVIIAIAGGMIAFARGDPEAVKKGTGTIKGVIIGLLLVYGAFAITSAFFSLLGVIQWAGFGDNLFSVKECHPIEVLVRPPVRPPT